jgi:hypothetical protein
MFYLPTRGGVKGRISFKTSRNYNSFSGEKGKEVKEELYEGCPGKTGKKGISEFQTSLLFLQTGNIQDQSDTPKKPGAHEDLPVS